MLPDASGASPRLWTQRKPNDPNSWIRLLLFYVCRVASHSMSMGFVGFPLPLSPSKSTLRYKNVLLENLLACWCPLPSPQLTRRLALRQPALPSRRCAKCDMKYESCCRFERVINTPRKHLSPCALTNMPCHTLLVTTGSRNMYTGWSYLHTCTDMSTTETCSHAWHPVVLHWSFCNLTSGKVFEVTVVWLILHSK